MSDAERAKPEKKKTPEEQTQELIQMGIACLLALGAMFLTIMSGMISLMRGASNPNPWAGPHTMGGGMFGGDQYNPPSMGGASSSTAETCGVCGQIIARGAQVCPYCQRKPDCNL